jgi:hypothetical protein
MILPCQRQGFVVDGQIMPPTHPQHPNNKPGVFAKAINTWQKKPAHQEHKKRKQHRGGSEIVTPNIAQTTNALPQGAYAS